MRSYVKPRHAVPYALDEPTLAPTLTLSAPGGSTDNYNMDVIGSGMTLTYENFIYIAMTGTFTGGTVAAASAAASVPAASGGEKRSFVDDVEEQQLVLDVEGTRVYLAKKETGKRSQGANSTV